MTHFPIRVAGIPAQAAILSYESATPGCSSGHPDHFSPPEEAFIDWIICDHRGRSAPWLDRKLTPAQREALETELISRIEASFREARDEAAIDSARSTQC